MSFMGTACHSRLRRSERRNRKKQHLDGQSDASGSLKISGGSDGVKERKVSSSTTENILEEQLKQVQLDIDALDNRRNQLEHKWHHLQHHQGILDQLSHCLCLDQLSHWINALIYSLIAVSLSLF